MLNNIDIQPDVKGKAIFCECFISEFGRYKILGSITDQGFVEILRGHKNKTIIETKEFLISCRDCGYRKFINLDVSMAL